MLTPPELTECGKLVETMYNDGLADVDVCWQSRHDPLRESCQPACMGQGSSPERVEGGEEKEEEGGKRGVEEEEGGKRGVVQWQDVDWSDFKLDVGSM